MNIIIKTQVIPDQGEPKEVAITFNKDSLTKIINESGLKKGNEALDNLVNKYVNDVKKIIGEVVNK